MSKSETLYNLAQQVIPGGVNSPVRAFNGVGGTPLLLNVLMVRIFMMLMDELTLTMSAHGDQWF